MQRIVEQIVEVTFPQITEDMELCSERICVKTVDISVPQVDVQDIVLPTKEEMVEVVKVTPHERPRTNHEAE